MVSLNSRLEKKSLGYRVDPPEAVTTRYGPHRFKVWGSRLEYVVWCLVFGFGVWGLGFVVCGLGCKVQGLGFGV